MKDTKILNYKVIATISKIPDDSYDEALQVIEDKVNELGLDLSWGVGEEDEDNN